MIGDSPDLQEPGQPIQARTINAPIRALQGLRRLHVSGGLSLRTGPGGIPLIRGIGVDQPFIARTGPEGVPGMTGPDGAGAYVMGQATVTVHDASRPPALTPTTFTLQVANTAAIAVGPNAIIHCKYVDGTPIVDWEACPT